MSMQDFREGHLISPNGEAIAVPPIALEPSRGVTLPPDFANTNTPLYVVGDRLRWRLIEEVEETDWGTVVGCFALPCPHRNNEWAWKYHILLDSRSPSAEWCAIDEAWEEDLEPLEEN